MCDHRTCTTLPCCSAPLPLSWSLGGAQGGQGVCSECSWILENGWRQSQLTALPVHTFPPTTGLECDDFRSHIVNSCACTTRQDFQMCNLWFAAEECSAEWKTGLWTLEMSLKDVRSHLQQSQMSAPAVCWLQGIHANTAYLKNTKCNNIRINNTLHFQARFHLSHLRKTVFAIIFDWSKFRGLDFFPQDVWNPTILKIFMSQTNTKSLCR